MWVLIDNYDSFTHILHHYLLQTGNECIVFRNDEITTDEIAALKPERIIISPGPETPLQAGITLQLIDRFYKYIPILGVCLGHQALGIYFGAKLVHTSYPMHGKISLVQHNGDRLFNSIPVGFNVMRYHSLAVEELGLTELDAIAHTQDGTIMALRHKQFPCYGVQFHPESVGTDYGLKILQNWAGIIF